MSTMFRKGQALALIILPMVGAGGCSSVNAQDIVEERICRVEDGRDYEMRWIRGVSVELRGRVYMFGNVHWLDNGGNAGTDGGL